MTYTEHIRPHLPSLRYRILTDCDNPDMIQRLCAFDQLDIDHLPLPKIRTLNLLESQINLIFDAFDNDNNPTLNRFGIRTDSDFDHTIERLEYQMISELLD